MIATASFAGGFMSVHKGEIPLDGISEQTTTYLDGFDAIVALYRRWSGKSIKGGSLAGQGRHVGNLPRGEH